METYPHKRTAAPDGYIRMSLATLAATPLLHLASIFDEGFLQELQGQKVPASSAGFSEWKSFDRPEISIGWGWFIHSRSRRLCVAPDGVRSNVMLIDALGYDLGAARTSNLFCSWLSEFEWRTVVGLTLQGVRAC